MGTLRFGSPKLADLEWPLIEISGAAHGPRLCVMAGIHVNEASSIDAAVTLSHFVDSAKLRGVISILPVVSVSNLYKYTLAVAPGEGGDLHWTFPGNPDGSFDEALAHALLFEWAKDAEVLLDLHGGDLDERMARYVVVQSRGEEVFDRRARELASCFETELVVALDPATLAQPGRCCTGLARFQRLALVAESGDQGSSTPGDVAWHRAGILNVARWLGMIDEPPRRMPHQSLFDRYEWINAPDTGIVQSRFKAGQFVERGARIGSMIDLYGRELASIEAPAAGCIMMQKTSQFARRGSWIGSVAVAKAT